MSDSLKDHINHKRDDFEIYFHDEKVGWDQLSTILVKNQRSGRKIWISAAAAVVLFLIAGLTLVNITDNDQYAREFQETQFYYQDLIDTKLHQVKQQVNDPVLLDNLAALDQAFKELKKDLDDDIQNEEVVLAMVDHYRLKLKILERILEELEDESNKENRGI